MKKIKLKRGVWYVIIILLLILMIGLLIKNIKKDNFQIEIKENIQKEEQKENNTQLETQNKGTEQSKEEKQVNIPKKQKNENNGVKTQNKGIYKITHYGADCKKCSGITASGYDVRNTIYYNDTEYGNIRIVAMSKSMPLYSVIKIKNYKLGGDIIAIVIDRGVGNGVIDLLTNSENEAKQLGIQKGVEIEILRRGKGE